MGKEKPFCTIDIPDAETAAYIKAVLNTTPSVLMGGLNNDCLRNFEQVFPGGLDQAVSMGGGVLGCGSDHVWSQLRNFLSGAGITPTSAPWLKPQAPVNIDGNSVTYQDDGIHVGCALVTWAEFDAMGDKRPEGAE